MPTAFGRDEAFQDNLEHRIALRFRWSAFCSEPKRQLKLLFGVGSELIHSARIVYDDCLFFKRFDRVKVGDKMLRYGLESLCSVADIPAFGVHPPLEELARHLARVSRDPEADLLDS